MQWSLDSIFATLGIDPMAEGVQIIAASKLKLPEPFAPLLPFVPTRPLLICGLTDEATVKRVHAVLLTVYPADYLLTIVAAGAASEGRLDSLNQTPPSPHLCLYLPAQNSLAAVRSFDTLREITARLRAPNGCPWDRQQTHESLKPFLLEETYEVLEALDSGNRQDLCEELGDLLMQVMIHAQVAAEAGEFDVTDVLAGIASKLVRRHPHVFGNVQVSGAQEVLRNWQSIKQAEKQANGEGALPSLLGGVPQQLPALAYAQAIQERAGRIGFLLPDEQVVYRISELMEVIAQAESYEHKITAYGDLLFALVQIARWLGVDAEEALRLANARIRRRFEAVEELCYQRGIDLHGLSSEQRERLWKEAADW